MSLLTLIKPIVGKPDATEDVKLVNALTAIETWANGDIDSSNLSARGVATANIALLAITAALIAKETITEEKLNVALQAKLAEKGTGLVLTNKWEGFGLAFAEAKIVSATRPAIVSVYSEGGVEETMGIEVFCGGERIAVEQAVAKGLHTFVGHSFWCPPNETIEVRKLIGGALTVKILKL